MKFVLGAALTAVLVSGRAAYTPGGAVVAPARA